MTCQIRGDDYSRCVKTVEGYLRPSSPRSSRSSLKSSSGEPKLSLITSSKSKSSRSSRSSKLKEMKKNVELKKLMAKQALDLAQYDAEIAREMRFKVQLEEKEVDLLALEDYDSPSNKENSVVGCKE